MDVMELSPDEFLKQFKEGSIPFTSWNHKAHLRMAFLIISKQSPDYKGALDEIRKDIQHFNSFHKEKLSVGFHETITKFWFELIAHGIKQKLANGIGIDFETFLNEYPELLNPNLLFKYYSKDLLFKNPNARTEWVPPDLTPLPFELSQ